MRAAACANWGTALGCPDLRTIYAEITAFCDDRCTSSYKTRLQFQAEATSKCTYPHLLPKRARIQRAVERGVAAHRIAYHEAGPKNPSHVFAFMGLHGVLAACMQVQGAGQRLQAVWFIDAAAQT